MCARPIHAPNETPLCSSQSRLCWGFHRAAARQASNQNQGLRDHHRQIDYVKPHSQSSAFFIRIWAWWEKLCFGKQMPKTGNIFDFPVIFGEFWSEFPLFSSFKKSQNGQNCQLFRLQKSGCGEECACKSFAAHAVRALVIACDFYV